MRHAYAHYFSKIYIVCYRIKPEKKKFIVLFPGKTKFASSKIFQNAVRFKVVGVNSPEWLVGMLQCISSRHPERGSTKKGKGGKE